MTDWQTPDGRATLITGDSLTVLKTLAADSVNLVVTSPPYYGLRDYGTATWEGGDPNCEHDDAVIDAPNGNKGQPVTHPRRNKGACVRCGAKRIDQQMGSETSLEAYVTKLVEVFREVRRVLHPTGVVFLNLGETRYSGPSASSRAVRNASAYGKHGKAPLGLPSSGRACPHCGGERPSDSALHATRSAHNAQELAANVVPPYKTTRDIARQGSTEASPGASVPGVQESTTPSLSDYAQGACDHEDKASVSPSWSGLASDRKSVV